jgi:ABC-2 type transport system permease protein
VTAVPATTPTSPNRFPAGTFAPAPGRGRLGRMLAAQAGVELRLAFRNGEQVLLTVLIPLALLIGSTKATLRKQAAGPEHAVME